MDKKVWFSRRALTLHAVILVVVPAFMALCFWQIHRAPGGNELSWAYVFEWPFFAGYAVYMWWRLLHEPCPRARRRPPPPTAATGGRPSAGPAPSDAGAPAETEQETSEDAESGRLQRLPGAAGRAGSGQPDADGSGGRARTSNIRLQRPTFCRLNYPGRGRPSGRCD